MNCNLSLRVAGCQAVLAARTHPVEVVAWSSITVVTRSAPRFEPVTRARARCIIRNAPPRPFLERARMRLRPVPLVVASLVLGASLAFAEPDFIVRYPNGVPQVSITGDYAGASYTVLRAPASGGPFVPITERSILCLGTCYAEDRTAAAGESYLYRFELVVPDGGGAALIAYGPFRATISPALARPVGVFAFPNPGRGATTVQLHVAGAPSDGAAPGEASIYDLAGRRVRVIHDGPVARGLTTLVWDGRDDRGVELKGGVYLLRFTANGGRATARIVRR